MKRRHIGIILMVFAAVMLASATILMKYIPQLTGMTPENLGIWRFLIGTPPLWLTLFFHKPSKKLVPSRAWMYLGLGVVFAVASFSALFSLKYLSASVYIIILYGYPSFVVLFALITGSPVPDLFWLGLPLTFVGLFLVTYEFGSTLSVHPLGLGLTLVNALAIAGYMILSEKVFRNQTDKLLGTNYMLTGAMISGLILVPWLGLTFPDTRLGWGLVMIFGIFSTSLPILAMNIGLQYIGAARGSVIVTLQPVLAVLFATVFLGESLRLQQWIGGLLVVFSVILIQLSSDRQRT